MQTESFLMRFFRRWGFDSIAWSLRRLYVPVSSDALVLEVGSGGNPYFRSNVLLDAFEFTQERHWAPLIKDRPTVLGYVESLPFKDKCFDFVVASHVFEHSTDPQKFLSELSRVAKAGYIEVPHAFMERVIPYEDHRLEIIDQNGTLIIRKKADWIVDKDLNQIFLNQPAKMFSAKCISKHPFDFHVRYYWSDIIPFQILNPDVKLDWQPPADTTKAFLRGNVSLLARIKGAVLTFVRSAFSQRSRNSKIDIFQLLICPRCKSSELSRGTDELVCRSCNSKYIIRANVADLKA